MDEVALGFDGLDGADGLAHAQVVDQHAVIEVDGEIGGGERVEDVALVAGAFGDGGAQLFAFADFGRLAGGEQGFGLGVELASELAQVFQHGVRGGGCVPVQVDERLERALVVGTAGVHPVDRPVLVHLDMIVVEIRGEILPQRLAEHLFDIGDVLVHMLLAERCGKERAEAGGEIVFEPFVVGDGDDVVRVRLERGVRDLRVIIIDGFVLGGENQARLVETIAAKHAADRVGDDLLNDIDSHLRVTLGGRVLRIGERRIALQRDALDRHVTRNLITHAIRIRHQLVVANLTLALFLGDLLAMCNVRRNPCTQAPFVKGAGTQLLFSAPLVRGAVGVAD